MSLVNPQIKIFVCISQRYNESGRPTKTMKADSVRTPLPKGKERTVNHAQGEGTSGFAPSFLLYKIIQTLTTTHN